MITLIIGQPRTGKSQFVKSIAGSDAVIIDPLEDYFAERGVDAANGAAVTKALNDLLLAHTNKHIVLVSGSGTPETARGHGALIAAADGVIQCFVEDGVYKRVVLKVMGRS